MALPCQDSQCSGGYLWELRVSHSMPLNTGALTKDMANLQYLNWSGSEQEASTLLLLLRRIIRAKLRVFNAYFDSDLSTREDHNTIVDNV